MAGVAALILALVPGAAASTCLDEPPSSDYTCEQQKGWGKCGEDWMIGSCCLTCFDCATEECGAAPAPGPPLPPLSPRAPCDPAATESTKQLLAYLYDISGKHTLTGQVESDHHNDDGGTATGTRTDWDKVANITGQHPAIYGNQFLWGSTNFTKTFRDAWVDRATALWRGDGGKGRGITHVNFHVCPPQTRFEDFRCSWGDIEGNPPNTTLVDAILTEGTDEHRIWLTAMDDMADYLKRLQDNDVPILWRPFHEMNGGWFWWGGAPERMTELWQQMFERYTQVHGLHNLLWVYGPDGQFESSDSSNKHIKDFYPGGDMVDALGLDIYHGNFNQKAYESVVTLADGRPVGLAEVGEAPTEEVLTSSQDRYAWFLMWGGYEDKDGGHNDPAALRELYNSDWFVTQGEVHIGDGATIV